MIIMGLDRADLRFMVALWRMNLSDRYLGSALGTAWAILNPLLMFALFTFVFGFVFKARLPGADSTLAYSVWLICGYGPWLANTEGLTAAASSIISNSGLVKNMSFKTELLPIAANLLGLVPLSVSIIFILFLQIISGEGWQLTLIFLPFVIVVQFLFLSAFGILIAAITTFVRDFGIVLPNLLMIILFATPIFYPVESVPVFVKGFMYLNPVYIIASGYRSIILGGQPIPFLALSVTAILSCFLLFIALVIFRRVKHFFPAVL